MTPVRNVNLIGSFASTAPRSPVVASSRRCYVRRANAGGSLASAHSYDEGRGKEMKLRRFRFLAVAALLAATAALGVAFAGGAAGSGDNQRFRWDIINVDFATGTISAGGQ